MKIFTLAYAAANTTALRNIVLTLAAFRLVDILCQDLWKLECVIFARLEHTITCSLFHINYWWLAAQVIYCDKYTYLKTYYIHIQNPVKHLTLLK